LLPSEGFFVRELPTLDLYSINGDSAGNYHLMNEESTGGMVIPLGTTVSLTRNPPEEWLFRREFSGQAQGIHRRNGIPPKLSADNKSTQGIGFRREKPTQDANSDRQIMNCNNFRISNYNP
jgi:hypothetical protein